jgi:Protein of unknown function (DUF2971)
MMGGLTAAVDLTVCSKEFQAAHPFLYHYTNKVGLAGIIKSRTVRATYYRNLNDSSEVIHLKESFIRELAPIFDQQIEEHKPNRHLKRLFQREGGVQKLARDFVNSLYGATFEGEAQFGPLDAYVACFCTHTDDSPYVQGHGLLSQWRGYAGGDGFCIVFDTPSLSHLLGTEFDAHYWVHLQMNAVRYAKGGTSLSSQFPELISAAKKTLADFFSGTSIPEMGVSEFLAGASLLKHQGFEEEREVRIVAIPGTSDLQAQARREHADFPGYPLPLVVKDGEQHRQYASLFGFEGSQLPVVRVIVGPSRNQAANAEFARSVVGSSVAVKCSATPWLAPG